MRIAIATQAHTFVTLQKKCLRSTILYDIHTRAAPKNLPKKVLKKAFRRAWISDCYIQLHFVKSTKFSLLVTRQDSGEAKWWMCTTQISDFLYTITLVQKTRKFCKKLKIKEIYNSAHTRTRQKWVLRRANLTVVYTILTFHTFFARRGPEAAARDDFGLATGYRLASQEGSCGIRSP